MAEAKVTPRLVTIIAAVAFPFDFLLGAGLVVAADLAQGVLRIGHVPEPAFIRMTGLFTIFLGYLYILVYRAPEERLILFQVTAVARGMLTILHFTEAQFLIPRPLFLTHGLFYGMSFADLVLFTAQAYALRKMGKGWLVV